VCDGVSKILQWTLFTSFACATFVAPSSPVGIYSATVAMPMLLLPVPNFGRYKVSFGVVLLQVLLWLLLLLVGAHDACENA
jgi:hypothetical protein